MTKIIKTMAIRHMECCVCEGQLDRLVDATPVAIAA